MDRARGSLKVQGLENLATACTTARFGTSTHERQSVHALNLNNIGSVGLATALCFSLDHKPAQNVCGR